MSHSSTTVSSLPAEGRTPGPRRKPVVVRALVHALSIALVAQPLAVSASDVAQQPLFAVSALPANVMLMLDDSTSMQSYRLPSPIASLQVTGSGCPTNWVRVKYDVIDDFNSVYGGFLDGHKIDNSSPTYNAITAGDEIMRCVHGSNEWRLRSPTVNPLWYNPAVHYQPWNDNGVRYAGRQHQRHRQP
jgi:hypothetical protein